MKREQEIGPVLRRRPSLIGATLLAVSLMAIVAPRAAVMAAELRDPADAPKPSTKEGAAAPVEKLERPWNHGVTPARQTEARHHLHDGNELLVNSEFAKAAAHYREGLAAWDHPGLHYNLALALKEVNQPVEVYHELELALRFGPGPLGQDKYDRAREYLRLFRQQIAEVDVRCAVKDAVVTLDDKELFRVGNKPMRYSGFLLPGSHRVAAAKPGYQTRIYAKVLVPGPAEAIDVHVYKEDQLVGYYRRWSPSFPIAVAAAGATTLLGAVAITMLENARYKSYDDYAAAHCADAGCLGDPKLAGLKQDGDRFRTIGRILYTTGGVTLAAGVVLLILNQKVPYSIEPEVLDKRAFPPSKTPFSPSAWLAPGGGGVAGTWSFR